MISWKLERVGWNPVALVDGFCGVFLLRVRGFESCVVCSESLEVTACVALDLLRVLCASLNVACIVLHLALRPSDKCRSSCY